MDWTGHGDSEALTVSLDSHIKLRHREEAVRIQQLVRLHRHIPPELLYLDIENKFHTKLVYSLAILCHVDRPALNARVSVSLNTFLICSIGKKILGLNAAFTEDLVVRSDYLLVLEGLH